MQKKEKNLNHQTVVVIECEPNPNFMYSRSYSLSAETTVMAWKYICTHAEFWAVQENRNGTDLM